MVNVLDTRIPLQARAPNIGNALEAFSRQFQRGQQNALAQRQLALREEGLQIQRENAEASRKLAAARLNAPTALQKNLIAGGLQPGTKEFQDAIIKGTQKGTNITIAGPKKGSEKMFEKTTEAFVKAQDDGAIAQDNLAQSEILRQSLSNPDLFTGTGGSAVQTFKSAAQALGFDVRGVADGEIVQTVGNKAALALKDDLPGPLSNDDRKFLVSIPPGLTKSPEANRRLLLISDLNNQYKVERAKVFREHLQEDGSVSPSVFNADAKLKSQFGRKMKSHVAELRAQAKQAKPRSPLVGTPIQSMSRSQLNKLNPNNLTRQQLQEAIEREKELDAQ